METRPDDAWRNAGFASAADALGWLIASGADEIVLDAAVDRFADSAKAEKPRLAPVVLQPPPQRPIAAPSAITAATSPEACATLADIAQALNFFETHPLRKNAMNLSFFEGPERAEILIVSDRPRSEEDKSGLVFAGKARILLANMLTAIGLKLDDVALLNLVPWRPAGNAAPKDPEITAVLPFVRRAVDLIQPRLILGFSALPGQYLAAGDPSIQRQRGKWLNAGGPAFLSTLHPDELLKHPLQKKHAWRDLLTFREKLNG
ncbi:uracil-DNA glycosylase [Aestuariivirga litoralis]|uniref:uracil-DNA glycosylase n=1 Tax=Aestuariivirga litoralis TaxID=2650924 RepID=UPI0018C7DD19|nr:uracil-DNA glycosylase [Aestuariivirga litoralis]MBG1233106.1 hypothetical protein [Aestuariivirga litoralis]